MDFLEAKKLKAEIFTELNSLLTTRLEATGKAFSPKIEIAVQQFATAITDLQQKVNRLDALVSGTTSTVSSAPSLISTSTPISTFPTSTSTSPSSTSAPLPLIIPSYDDRHLVERLVDLEQRLNTNVSNHLSSAISGSAPGLIAKPYDDAGLKARLQIDEDAIAVVQAKLSQAQLLVQDLQNGIGTLNISTNQKHNDVIVKIGTTEANFNAALSTVTADTAALRTKLNADDQSIQALQNSIHQLQTSQSQASSHAHSSPGPAISSLTAAPAPIPPVPVAETRLEAIVNRIDHIAMLVDQANNSVKSIINYNDTVLNSRLIGYENVIQTLLTKVAALEAKATQPTVPAPAILGNILGNPPK